MEKVNRRNKLFMLTTIYVLIIVLLLTTVTYAWFSVTNLNKGNLISQISGIEAEYEFYVYNDPTHEGSTSLTLVNNTTTDELEYGKYLYIPNPTETTLIDGYVAPGERFSFAIKIYNTGTTQGYVSLSFSNVNSFGYATSVNKIQNAFSYEVTQVSFMSISGVETSDIKDTYALDYKNDFFDGEVHAYYELINDAPLNIDDFSSTVIYFDIYFDPFVYGIDPFGDPYTNSNIFMGQSLKIQTVNMVLSA